MTEASHTSVLSTPEERAYEARAAENSIWSGGRLMMGIYAFAFAALAFAYFYLRSTNSEELWRPNGVTAPTGLGAAIMASTVFATVLVAVGLRRFRRDLFSDWMVSGWTAVLAGLVALALQILEMTNLPFHPGVGGYTSVFVGWTGMNLLLLISGIYWMETLLARHVRLRRALSEEGATPTSQFTSRLFRVNVETCADFWLFIAAVSIFFWVFMYLSV
ncbi:MAG: hypothetical protein ACRDWE_12815 [Acidimicrobiales bacterium]